MLIFIDGWNMGQYVTVIRSNYEIESIRGIPGLARRLILESLPRQSPPG